MFYVLFIWFVMFVLLLGRILEDWVNFYRRMRSWVSKIGWIGVWFVGLEVVFVFM